MRKLRRSAGWGVWQPFGGVKIWFSMLLFLCGFCSRTGGDVSIDSTVYVTVAVTDDWITTLIPSQIVRSSTPSPQEGFQSSTTPLAHMSRITSQPVGSDDIITPSEILATATSMVTEQYISTLYGDPQSSTRMEMTPTLLPSTLFISQRTDIVTEWSDMRETLVSTVLYKSPDNRQTNLPESARTILPSRTKREVPSTLFPSLPVSLQPTTTVYMSDTDTFSESYAATPPLLEETLVVTSVVTYLSTPLGVSETSNLDQIGGSTLYRTQSFIASSHPSASFESDTTTASMDMNLSSNIYFTETSDFLYSYVTTQNPSTDLESTLLLPSFKESVNPESLHVTIILSSTIYITESTEILQPSSQPLNPKESVGSEITTIFEEIATTEIMTDIKMMTSIDEVMTSLTTDKSVLSTPILEPTPVITQASSSEWKSEDIWITSEVVETLVVSSDKPMVSETFGYSRGLSGTSVSTLFPEVTSRGVLDTLSLYETMTVESPIAMSSILSSPVTLRPESPALSTSVTNNPVQPSISPSIPEYSTVLEVITSVISGTDDLLVSTNVVDSPLPMPPTSVQSFIDSSSLQSGVYETLIINTEVIYSTVVQSLPPSPFSSDFQSEVPTASPASSICVHPSSCTCFSPPPSLPPNLCSKIDCSSSMGAPSSTLPLDYSEFEIVTITSDVILYPTPDTSEISTSSDVTPLIGPQSSYDLSKLFSDNSVVPSETISFPMLSTTLQPEATVVPSPYLSSDSNIQSIVSSYIYEIITTEEFEYISTELYDISTPSARTTGYEVSSTKETEMFSSIVMETSAIPIYTTVIIEPSTILVSDTIIDPTPSDGLVTTASTAVSSEIAFTSLDPVIPSFFYSTVFDISTILVSDTIIAPTPSSNMVATGSTALFSEVAATSLDAVTPSIFYSTLVDVSTILVSDTIMESMHSDGLVTSGSTSLFSESTVTSLDSITPSFFYSSLVDVSTILVTDTIIEPTPSDGLVATGSTAMFSESTVTSLDLVTPSLLYSTALDFSTILVSDTILESTPSDGLTATGSTVLYSGITASSFESITPSFFYSTALDFSTILVSDTIIEPTPSDGLVATGSTAVFSESTVTSLDLVTPSFFYSTAVDFSTILVSDTIIEPTPSDGLVPTGSTALFSEIVATSLDTVTPSISYSTALDFSTIVVTDTIIESSTILVSDTILEPTPSEGLVATVSTIQFSESIVTSLDSITPSFFYSTAVDFSTILVSETVIGPTPSDGLVATGSTALFSEIAVSSLNAVTPLISYSTALDFSTVLVSDTILEPVPSDGLVTTGSIALFSERTATPLDSVTPSFFYSTALEFSAILVSDTIVGPTPSELVTIDSTAMFSESTVTSLDSLTPPFFYSTAVDFSTILVTETVIVPSTIIFSNTMIEPTPSDGLVTTDSTALFSESIVASLVSVTPSFFYSTALDLSTIQVTDTIIEPSTILVSDTNLEPTPSDKLVVTGSSALFSERTATLLDSATPSLFFSTAVDFTTIPVSDGITDVTSVLSTFSEQDLTPSTPVFSTSMLPILTTFPTLTSYAPTPSLEISSVMMYTTLELESSISSESPQGLSSLVTQVSNTYDSVSPLSSLYMTSDDFPETLLTSEIVTLDLTSIFPTTMSNTLDYFTLPMTSSYTFEPSAQTEKIGTLSTIQAESSTPIPFLTRSLQMSSLDTFIYTTMLDTVVTNTLITLDYPSSEMATSSGMSIVSTLELHDTVSESYFASSFVPSFTTIDSLTSSNPTLEFPTPIMSSETISISMPDISSVDSYSTLVLPPIYSSSMSGSYETVTPVQTTYYMMSTMLDPTILTSVSETGVLATDNVTPVVSSTSTLLEPSDVVSDLVTETDSFYSQLLPSTSPTSAFLVPISSDSLTSGSSSFLVSETPPLTSMPLLTSASLSREGKSTSAVLSELPPTFTVPFSASEVLLSSSFAPERSTTMIFPSASQMITTSIPTTLAPVTSTTELPIEVPQESQLTMNIKVPITEDITAEEFSETLSNNLEILYIEAEDNVLLRRRRSISDTDTPQGDRLDQEWIFTRKRQAEEVSTARQDIKLQDNTELDDEPRVERLTMDSSTKLEWMFVSKQAGRTREDTESRYRRKRQTNRIDEIEVPILMLSRSDDTDPETVTMTFYVMENESLVLATDAAATYSTLTEAEMSAQLGYAVRSMPHPVIPNPTTTPDYPYPIPPADQTDWLKVTLKVDIAFDETNATFQKQLRNDLEFLYVNGSDGLGSRTRRDAERWDDMNGLEERNVVIRRRRAADPSSSTEVALESVDRSQPDADDVDVAFYVVDEGLVVPGENALLSYQQYTLQELYDVIGYQVVSPGVTLYLSPSSPVLAWWWWLIIAVIILLVIIVIIIFFYYFCWAKKTAVKSLNKVDRSTSVELGFLRLEKEPKAKLVAMETSLTEKASKRRTVNGTASKEAELERVPEDAVVKRPKKKRSKRVQESTREYAKRGYLSDEDEQLFSHVDTHSARKPKTKKAVSTSRFQNTVYPEAERLPPLKHRPLVAYSETESEISTEQIRMLRKAGAPKSWYTTHIDKDPEELRKDIAKEKRRQKRKKEKKLHDQLTAEQMQKEFDAVLGGTDEIRNPTARQLQYNRTDRWKPKSLKRESEIPEAGPVNESAVRLIRTRPLESAAPPVTDHEAIKKEIEELLKRGPPKQIQGPLSNPAISQDQAKELAEKKEREVRLRRKWAEERKKINRILDEAFELSSTTFSNPRDQTREDNPSTAQSREREFDKDLADSGYLRHRSYSGYGALDDSILPGMMPGMLPMSSMSTSLYDTRLGLNLSGEHLYDSIRRPPIEYEFLPSQMRSDGVAPAYGVSVSPVRAQRARVTPYPARGYMATDPYRSLNSSLSSSLQPMQITPRHHNNGIEGTRQGNGNDDEGQDIIRVQEENMSLQRLVAKQQRELDHALALIGQPNSRIGQSEKSPSREGKIGSNGRKQRRVVPVNSTKPLNGPETVSAWTDDHKVVERTSHPVTSTPNKEHLIKVKPRPSQREGSVILEHHIEKPGKGTYTSKV